MSPKKVRIITIVVIVILLLIMAYIFFTDTDKNTHISVLIERAYYAMDDEERSAYRQPIGSTAGYGGAIVLEIVSSRSLLVEIIPYFRSRLISHPPGEERDGFWFYEGETIKVVFADDNDFIEDVIARWINVGTAITFSQVSANLPPPGTIDFEIPDRPRPDFTQQPPIVPATGIAVYRNNGTLRVNRLHF